MFDLLITVFYQPFLNLVVGFYWLLGKTPIGYDMGVAVILLTLTIRFLLMPLTIASHRSEDERRQLSENVKNVKEQFEGQPVEQKEAIKQTLRSNPRIILAEAVMFVIQLGISLILWRIFASGLEGRDLHLLYSWMPHPPTPYNLEFIGRFDLAHPDWQLNVIQTILIFAMETTSIILSPYPVSREEVVRLQLVLPLVSFFVFAFLPAGKKLFVITTLAFSLIYTLLHHFIGWWQRTFPPPPPEEESAEEPAEVAEPAVATE